MRSFQGTVKGPLVYVPGATPRTAVPNDLVLDCVAFGGSPGMFVFIVCRRGLASECLSSFLPICCGFSGPCDDQINKHRVEECPRVAALTLGCVGGSVDGWVVVVGVGVLEESWRSLSPPRSLWGYLATVAKF